MDKKKNRPKKQRISVCVDEELSNKILEAQKLGYTKSAYIQSLIRDKPIININLYRQLIPYICEIEKQMEFEDDVNVKRAVREELNKICHVLKL